MLFTEKDLKILSMINNYPMVYTYEAAVTEPSYVIRDRIYPYIDAVLSTPLGNRQFRSLVERFVDRNSQKLHEPCPISMIAFMDSDKDAFFSLFKLSESETRAAIKEMLKTVSQVAQFRLITQNPIFVVLYCCIRFYTLKKDKSGLTAALTIYALANYPSIFHKYFKYGANEGVMRYTADQLTEKYIFKTTGHVFGALSTSINSSYSFLQSYFVDMKDVEIVRFIQRVRNDQNSLIKKIAIRYHDNYKKGNSISTQSEVYDTGDIIDDRHNDTSIVESFADKISVNIITNGLNLQLLETASSFSEISMVELRIYIIQILVSKKMEELKQFISSVLFIYLYNEKHKVDDIHSKEFIAFGIELFRKTKSNDRNISNIKKMLDKWGDETGIHSKYRRDHTKSSYKKGIFWYILLSIQYLA